MPMPRHKDVNSPFGKQNRLLQDGKFKMPKGASFLRGYSDPVITLAPMVMMFAHKLLMLSGDF